MKEELNLCIEIIKKAQEFMDRKDYNGLRMYLDEKKEYVENCRIMSENKEAEYIDSLIKDLDNT